MQRGMRVSSRTIARGADQQRARSASGLTPVSSPSGSVLRKRNTDINKAFWDDFEAIPCQYSSDGCLYRVKNLPQWVRKVLWIRGKDLLSVAYMKANADGGQGSLKLLLQILHKDDPILTHNLTQEELKQFQRDVNFLHTGVNCTFILAIIPGAKESVPCGTVLTSRGL